MAKPVAKKRAAKLPYARIVRAMEKATGRSLPSVSEIALRNDPFEILVSTVISLRTKDEVTLAASERLFKIAPNAAKLAKTNVRSIEKAIYPAGFYKTKARDLKQIAKEIVKDHDGKVPDTIDELLNFKGVGRKTANLVITLGYGKLGICVDTHVHRISNRLGWVKTKTPDDTEFALMDVLPKKFWIGINEIMVGYGQQVCKPISPHCSTCPVNKLCPRIGVTTSR